MSTSGPSVSTGRRDLAYGERGVVSSGTAGARVIIPKLPNGLSRSGPWTSLVTTPSLSGASELIDDRG